MWVVRSVASNGWMEISQVYRGVHTYLEQPSFGYSDNIKLICFRLYKIYFVLILLELRCIRHRSDLVYLVPG